MAEAARLELPLPETAVVEEGSLGEQTLALASDLPARPVVLGGCCCAHVGAVEGLAARHGRIAVVWLDAHGDLNTPESSTSGNAWGMPLRLLIDSGAVRVEDVALVGARNLDPPEREYLAASGLGTGPEAVGGAVAGAAGVYVALDVDVLEPGELAAFLPEPGGPTLSEVERLLGGIRASSPVVGAGITGLRPDPAAVPPLTRLLGALGL
jgi:arginase